MLSKSRQLLDHTWCCFLVVTCMCLTMFRVKFLPPPYSECRSWNKENIVEDIFCPLSLHAHKTRILRPLQGIYGLGRMCLKTLGSRGRGRSNRMISNIRSHIGLHARFKSTYVQSATNSSLVFYLPWHTVRNPLHMSVCQLCGSCMSLLFPVLVLRFIWQLLIYFGVPSVTARQSFFCHHY